MRSSIKIGRVIVLVISIAVVCYLLAVLFFGYIKSRPIDVSMSDFSKIVQQECTDINSVTFIVSTPSDFKKVVNSSSVLASENLKQEIVSVIKMAKNSVTGERSLMPRYEESPGSYRFLETTNYTYKGLLEEDSDGLIILLTIRYDPLAKIQDSSQLSEMTQDTRYVIISGARYRHGKQYDQYAFTKFATQDSTIVHLDWSDERIKAAIDYIIMKKMC